jgi:hypothetical protein
MRRGGGKMRNRMEKRKIGERENVKKRVEKK